MNEHTSFRVQEFARLAGVTVRTLHFYDESGLLAPSGRSERGHRRYRRHDLLRLQQILTLKHLGFGLEEIRALLAAPAYDLRASLRMQKEAVEGEILRLQSVAYALTRTLDTLEQTGGVDWIQVVAIIHGLREADRRDWVARFFPPETWEWLRERAAHMPSDMVQRSTDAWQELYAGFQQRMHLPPEHPEVQALAAQMQRLIDMFTGGNPEVERGMRALYRDPEQIPAAYRMTRDPALQTFMDQAVAIYRQSTGAD